MSTVVKDCHVLLLRVAMLAHDSIVYFIVIFGLCLLALNDYCCNLNHSLFLSMPYIGYSFKQ
jgi:hypothetical protein